MAVLDEFFQDHDASLLIFEAVHHAMEAIGPTELRVGKSQVAFRRRIGFAYVWMPDQYLGAGHTPLVLSVALRRKDASPRWKQIVEPVPGRYMHHLELYSSDQIDNQVKAWLQEAWTAAA
jgi:hypothetical protein